MRYLALTIALILLSCDRNGTDDLTLSGVQIIQTSGNEKYVNQAADVIFNQDSFYSFYLELPERSLAFLDANPTAEEYVEGTLKFKDEIISPVGIRYKGSIGAFVGSVSGENWTNPSGYKTATKLSTKIKINWLDNHKTFYGLKKLQLHSQNLDPSQMHERLAYWLYRQMGVIAPRSVHAKLYINNIFQGVYALTEQIDDQFIKANFNDHNGNLYKEIWPLKSDGTAMDENSLKNALKTNQSDGDVSRMKSFAQQIIDSDDNNLSTVVAQSMDTSQIVAYTIVDRMIKNDDGAFHWYCFFQECAPHNFYWYENTNGEFTLIPWDMDNAFENINNNTNPVTLIADELGEQSNNCSPFPYGEAGLSQKSAACDKLTLSWTKFTALKNNLKETFINGPFSGAEIEEKLQTWSHQIESATAQASQSHKDAISLDDWHNAVEDLRLKIDFARDNY